MKDPLGVSPSKGNQGTTRGKEKIILVPVGIEPTTSGLDLTLLCRLRSDRESRGRFRWRTAAKRKHYEHNWWNRELTGLSWASPSTLIYTSKLILCSTIYL